MSATIGELTLEQIFDGSHSDAEVDAWFDTQMSKEDQTDMSLFHKNMLPLVSQVLPTFLTGVVTMADRLDDSPLSVIVSAMEVGAYAYRQVLQAVDPTALMAVDKALAHRRGAH